MSKHWQRDLDALQRAVLAMSSQVEEMIEKACRALRDGRIEEREDTSRLVRLDDDNSPATTERRA